MCSVSSPRVYINGDLMVTMMWKVCGVVNDNHNTYLHMELHSEQ